MIAPTPVGAIIKRDILDRHDLTQDELARRLRVSRLTINELVRGRRALTPGMALRFGRLTGQPARWWIDIQAAHDIWQAQQRDGDRIAAEVLPLSPEP